MKKGFRLAKYGLSDYDDCFCLRPPWFLVASMLFLCRDWVLVLAVAALTAGGASVTFADFVPTDHLRSSLPAAIPAVFVLYALLAKTLGGPRIVRWLWRNGRVLLMVSALLQVAIAVAPYWPDVRDWVGGPPAEKAIVLGELLVVGYVLLSARVKDTFFDFPAA